MLKNIINYIKGLFKKDKIHYSERIKTLCNEIANSEEIFNYHKGYNYITQDSAILDKNNIVFKKTFGNCEFYPDYYYKNASILKLWVNKPKFKNNVWVGNEEPLEGIIPQKLFNETNPKYMIIERK